MRIIAKSIFVFVIIICFSIWHTLIHKGDSIESHITNNQMKSYVDSVVQYHLGNIILDHSLESMRYEIDSLKLEIRDIGTFTLSVVDMVYPETEHWDNYDIVGKHTDSIDIDEMNNYRTREIALSKLQEVFN